VSLTRARVMVALDAAFDEHLKVLFDFLASPTDKKPREHFETGLSNAIDAYATAATVIAEKFPT
jgi:hypothetical protein